MAPAILSSALRARWTGEGRRIESIVADLRAGADWTQNLLASTKSGWKALPFLASTPKEKLAGESAPRDLRGIRLTNLELQKISGLADASLDLAVFEDVAFTECSFVGSSLDKLKAVGMSLIERSDFTGAHIVASDLRGISLAGSNFTDADLSGTNLEDTDLRGCLLKRIIIRKEHALGFVGRSRVTKFGGEYQNTHLLHEDSDNEARRFVASETGRLVLCKAHPGLAALWYYLANYGRSPARLLFWVLVVWGLFGILYARYPVPRSLEGTVVEHVLVGCAPMLRDSRGQPARFETWFAPFYFSAATLTTLGYGDFTPALDDWCAQVYVSIEAFMGYVFLGVFVSLLLQNVLPRD